MTLKPSSVRTLGEDVPDLQLVSYGKTVPPLTNGKPPVDTPELDPLVAAGVHPQNDFSWDGSHVPMKGIGDQK